MEKRKPHYGLATIQAAVRARGVDAFTASALIGALTMGISEEEAVAIVCAMSRADFFKSMTTHASSQIWQDVYHATTASGKVAYVKVTQRPNGAIVISFKEK